MISFWFGLWLCVELVLHISVEYEQKLRGDADSVKPR